MGTSLTAVATAILLWLQSGFIAPPNQSLPAFARADEQVLGDLVYGPENTEYRMPILSAYDHSTKTAYLPFTRTNDDPWSVAYVVIAHVLEEQYTMERCEKNLLAQGLADLFTKTDTSKDSWVSFQRAILFFACRERLYFPQ